MPAQIGSDERTNALGLFNTARSYWRSAEQLNANPPKVSHPLAPITFLFCHAIELYLKAYLRGTGQSVAALRKIGHRITELAKEASAQGLRIEPEQSGILAHLDDFDVAIEARYIVTGPKSLPTNEALSATTGHLDQTVGSALADKGVAIRREYFEKPRPQTAVELDPETIAILVHLFRAQSEQDRDISIMAQLFDLEPGVVQYELDKLQSANLAEVTDLNPIWGTVSWGLTAEGRRYVVEKRLHKLDAT